MLNNIIKYAKTNPKKVAAWVLSVIALAGAAISPDARDLIMQAVTVLAGG